MNEQFSINEENIQKELDIQKEIDKCIDKFSSFYFDAGAGAGKTYSLEKSIEHILGKRSLDLMDANQKILCITYTNVAKNEILDRIGQNSLVLVSTIHEFLWKFIGHQQPLLTNEHKIKIESELLKIEDSLSLITFYDRLEDKEKFNQTVLREDFLNIFYEQYSVKASDFKTVIKEAGKRGDFDLEPVLSNVSKFKKVVTLLDNQQKLKEASTKLSQSDRINIEYRPTRNRDNLSKFIISHNTLLEYSSSIIKKKNLLKRLFYDKYPYVLIDEYQDTDKKVIEIFNSILELSRRRKRNFFIGYFGDYMQNIYSDGVGRIDSLVNNFISIKKIYNRRSTTQVIELIEKIRNDNFGQISIYDNFDNGSCQFHQCDDSNFNLSNFISEKLNNDCVCLLLKNDKIAEERGFNNLLSEIGKFPKFSGTNYENIGSEFLTRNLQNMGWFLREIFNFIDFNMKVENKKSTVKMLTNFFDSSSRITYRKFKILIDKINSINCTKLGDYIQAFINIANDDSEMNKVKFEIKSIFENIFSVNDNKGYMEQLRNQAYDYFYCSSKDAFDEKGDDQVSDKSEEDMSIVNSFLDVDIKEFISWYKYLQDDGRGEGVRYYTLHGSKGLEFDNVVIVLEDNFARRKDYIKFFFNNYNNSVLTDEEQSRFNSVRNLLYVACSRARSNLHVVYLGDLEHSENEVVNEIFGE